MGIENFNKAIKDHFGLPEKIRYLSEFSGKRVCIDTHNYMFKQLYGAQKRTLATTDIVLLGPDRSETLKSWIGMILNLMIDFIEFGVTPVAVFDGTSVPEKGNTKKKRRNKNDEKSNRIKELEKQIEKFDPVSVPHKITEELRNLYSQVVYVSYEEQEYLRNILTSIGIPVVQAVGEAEQLCSMMCIDGIVSAVYSTDTDNYPLGCPILITKIEKKTYVEDTKKFDRKLTTISLSDILSVLKISFPTFVDLCIMAGNDFNENIPDIALWRAYKLLINCGSIEKLPEKLDVRILNYRRSREIFKVRPWKECYVSGSIDLPEGGLPESARDVMESIGKESILPRLLEVIKNCPKAKDRGWSIPPDQQKRLTLKSTVKLKI